MFYILEGLIISQRAKDLYWVYWCLLWDNMGGKGSELFLPSVCDLLRKMVLARGWSEGLYSMGRSGSRSNRINPLRMDLKPKWMATTDTTISSQQNVLSTGVATLWWRWSLNALKQCFDSLKILWPSFIIIQIWPLSRTHGSLVNTLGTATPLKQEEESHLERNKHLQNPNCFKISLFLLNIFILHKYWG